MQLSIYQIDAFAEQLFEGNPAAVIPLKAWLPDHLMQSIAEENNLSETAFFLSKEKRYSIRWFTPNSEVDLCGHATLASAYVIFNIIGHDTKTIEFESHSGLLSVTGNKNQITLDFPLQKPDECGAPDDLIKGLGCKPVACLAHEDFLVVLENEQDLASIKPDMHFFKRLPLRGVIVTAPSENHDFVARCFFPKLDVPEDPVTGSAYTQLAPYWGARLARKKLRARQISSRGGEVICQLANDRVLISGGARKYLEGSIEVDV